MGPDVELGVLQLESEDGNEEDSLDGVLRGATSRFLQVACNGKVE